MVLHYPNNQSKTRMMKRMAIKENLSHSFGNLHYNMVISHMALQNQTPAQKIGVRKEKVKRIDLLQFIVQNELYLTKLRIRFNLNMFRLVMRRGENIG